MTADEGRIGRVEGILEEVRTRLNNLENRLTALDSWLTALELRMTALESRMQTQFYWLLGVFLGVMIPMWVTIILAILLRT